MPNTKPTYGPSLLSKLGFVPAVLPIRVDVETKRVLKRLATARGALAELKGTAGIVPNEGTLISTLSLQEAKDSSAIENIITTHDDLFRSDAKGHAFVSLAAKEVYNYVEALTSGYIRVQQTHLITCNDIIEIQSRLEQNRAGFRVLPGTELRNDSTGETVFIPTQSNDEIIRLMNNLEAFLNDEALSDLDPLIKMTIVHHQFETIHPFYDGNGRTGRIVNILYLVKEGLLNTPVLYLSRYINQHKAEYYRLLQAVRADKAWEEWVLFMLAGVEVTAIQTTKLIHEIRDLMQRHKMTIRGQLPKIYSQDLLNNIFNHPYSKISFVERDLGVTRVTATKYLEELCRIGIMDKLKVGRDNYYINIELVRLLTNVQTMWQADGVGSAAGVSTASGHIEGSA